MDYYIKNSDGMHKFEFICFKKRSISNSYFQITHGATAYTKHLRDLEFSKKKYAIYDLLYNATFRPHTSFTINALQGTFRKIPYVLDYFRTVYTNSIVIKESYKHYMLTVLHAEEHLVTVARSFKGIY